MQPHLKAMNFTKGQTFGIIIQTNSSTNDIASLEREYSHEIRRGQMLGHLLTLKRRSDAHGIKSMVACTYIYIHTYRTYNANIYIYKQI